MGGYNSGVTDYSQCGQGTGMNYCPVTGECMPPGSGPICPECDYDSEDLGDSAEYCTVDGKDRCCTGGCPGSPEGNSCIVVRDFMYDFGVADSNNCPGPNRVYCESSDRCISAGDKTCAQCPNNKPLFCQIIGGGKCCDELDEDCTNYEPDEKSCIIVRDFMYDFGDRDSTRCKDRNEAYCESKRDCIRAGDKTCAQCPSNKPFYCQIIGGGKCCDELDEECTNYSDECDDNNNSGPRGPIQCKSNDDCCVGFKCKLDKAKCTPINDKAEGEKNKEDRDCKS